MKRPTDAGMIWLSIILAKLDPIMNKAWETSLSDKEGLKISNQLSF